MKDLKSIALFRLKFQSQHFSKIASQLFYQRQLSISGISKARNIMTHMTVDELTKLYDLAFSLDSESKVLEIGSYLGASSCYLAAALSLKNGHLFCVDTWENQTMPEGVRDTFLEFKENTSGISKHITVVRKWSQALTEKDINLPLNLVFIDGDHNYSAVKHDFMKVSPWIIEGGMLVFHDCTYYESVSRVVGEILASGTWQLGGNIDSLVWLRKVGSDKHCFPNPMN